LQADISARATKARTATSNIAIFLENIIGPSLLFQTWLEVAYLDTPYHLLFGELFITPFILMIDNQSILTGS
jgi:hypothetical protein